MLKERNALTGETFIRAFNLTRERGGQSQRSRILSRDIDIAAWVHIAQKRGLTIAEAKGKAGDAFEVEVTSIDRSLRNAGPVTQVNEEAYEWLFAERGTPLPEKQ